MINKYFLAKMNIPAYLKKFLYERYGYTEIEGIPPIIFKGNGKNLLDYRIDGANGGVGDLITDSSDENFGKYKVPVMVEGKNLLQNTARSQTINGVTFTVNEDGSVTCNGTCVSNGTNFYIKKSFKLDDEAKRYTLTGCPKGGGRNSTYVLEYSNAINSARTDSGNGVTFTPYSAVDYPNAWVRIIIFAGYTCNNLTFYPMIRKADIEDDTYEPYIEPTTTNIYLDEPIEENESISLSDTNVNIPTIMGTNVLTVDTTIQPSKVLIRI